MDKKKSSSIKGLIFVLVILGIIGTIIIWHLTKSNMTVNITVYDAMKPVPGATVLVNDKKPAITLDDGTAKVQLRVNLGDTLTVIAKAPGNKIEKKGNIVINQDRFLTTYTNIDILLVDSGRTN